MGSSCQSSSNKQQNSDSEIATTQNRLSDEEIAPRYAEGYQVRSTTEGIRLVDIQNPQEPKSTTYRFALVPRGSKLEAPEGYTLIETPIKSCICMTSLQLSNFIALDACEFVTGVTSTRHLFNEKMNRQIKEGRTAKIGIEGNFDSEVVMSMNPDVIFISPFKRGGYEQMKEVHLPLVPHLGYKETTPLGQAEWVKLIGLFVDKEQEAIQLFNGIEQRYLDLKAKAAKVEKRPIALHSTSRPFIAKPTKPTIGAS